MIWTIRDRLTGHYVALAGWHDGNAVWALVPEKAMALMIEAPDRGDKDLRKGVSAVTAYFRYKSIPFDKLVIEEIREQRADVRNVHRVS